MTTSQPQQFRVRDRRGDSRYFIDNDFMRGGWAAKVGPYGLAVYNALAIHVDADSQDGYPSYAKIAELTGMSTRQAQRKIAELEELNVIRKESRFNKKGEQTSNEYALLHKDEWKPVGDDSQSPRAMPVSHPPYDSESPKQDSINKTPINNKEGDKSPPLKAKSKSQKTERPAGVNVYRGIANRFPDKATWPQIDQAVGNNPDDLKLWGDVVRNYISCGWNKVNINGMLDYFKRREIPTTRRKTNGNYSKPTTTYQRKTKDNGTLPTVDPFNQPAYAGPR